MLAVGQLTAGRIAVPVILVVSLFLLACSSSSPEAAARAWTPQTRLALLGHEYMPGPRIASDSDGNVRIAVFVHDASADSVFGLAWAGDQWAVRWRQGRNIYPGLVLSTHGENCQLWLDFAPVPGDVFGVVGRLVLACSSGDETPSTDSVTTVNNSAERFAALVGTRYRWVAVDERLYGVPGDELRLYRSATPGQWDRLPASGRASFGVTVGELANDSALLVWSDISLGMHWGVADGHGLVERGVLSGFASSPGKPYEPRLRSRPSGGFWLSWGPDFASWAGIASFANGAWSAPGQLTCAYTHPLDWNQVQQTAMSQDSGEYPAVAWRAIVNPDVATMCAIIPTDSGFTEAVDLGYTLEGFDPTVARDRNGDVWLAWWSYSGGTSWTHSYTSATASVPRVVGAGSNRTLAWTLSEPAPETWWAVLRGVNGGTFEPVARVRAGPSVEMSWTDTPPPAGLLAYKIRRECLDTHYQWESDAVTVGAGARSPIYLGPPVGVPGGGGTEEPGAPEDRRWGWLRLSISGAEPGPLAARVYDLQGREVLSHAGVARGGPEPFELDLAEARRTLATGIYFLRVSDASGRSSNAVRFVILK